jgi:DUF4097 and DUF4098 domain-containing protein YvlB
MKTRCSRWDMAIGLGILSFAVAGGCHVELGSWSQARSEKTIRRQVPCGTSRILDVATQSGSIHITGADTSECGITAHITAHAPTEEEAQELADQVEIHSETSAETLSIRDERPRGLRHRSISVSYTITIPSAMNVKCGSDYGSLNVSQIKGTVNGRSGNGSIQVEDIGGGVNLNTSYGSITCRRVAGGTTTLRSGNGSIHIETLKGPADIESSYGSISCQEYSDGDLRLKSSNGRVTLSNATFGRCEARSSYGTVACRTVKGRSLELDSGNGNLELTDAEATEMKLSSSYGSLQAQPITTGDLKARSGNGSIHIVCSPATPANLTAEVESSYGRIDFTAPGGFTGQVYLSTSYGSIRTSLPITTSGEISRQKIAGRIGTGTGMLRLETRNGSIDLK